MMSFDVNAADEIGWAAFLKATKPDIDFSIRDLEIIHEALVRRHEVLHSNAAYLNAVSSQVRKGSIVPPFPQGEDGAEAATRMAQEKHVRATTAKRLADRISVGIYGAVKRPLLEMLEML